MSLSWRDIMATCFVGTAVLTYVWWLTGTGPAGISGPRAAAAVIFGLGIAACYSDQQQMTGVYGAGGHVRAPMPYVVITSVLGGAALGAGVIAMITGSSAMIATLTAAMAALWAISIVRHVATTHGRTHGKQRTGRAGAPTAPGAV